MKIAYVTSWDAQGQQFNGHLLMHMLRAANIDARMFVNFSNLSEPGLIYQIGGTQIRRINYALSLVESQLSLQNIFPILSYSLTKQQPFREVDLVHLQLIHATPFISLLSLPWLSRQKPLVLTLHDPWMATGHCIYPMDCQRWETGCGKCPYLHRSLPLKHDSSALNWRIKKEVFKNTRIQLVVASNWMKKIVENSPILSHLPCELIPLGLDTSIFKPQDKAACKKAFGIPEDAYVISFRAVPFSAYKGVKYIEKALLAIKQDKPIHLITFDTVGLMPKLTNLYKTVELGWTGDTELIAKALCASDLFLMPSIAEAFGMMAVEAMACGTPVIGFDGTALPDVIHAPRGGITVPYEDWEALRDAIDMLIGNPDLHKNLAQYGLQLVKDEYTVQNYVKRHFDLYQKIITESKTSQK